MVKIGVLVLYLVALQLAAARPAQVVLLRHAEKPADESNLHLSPRGEQRAKALPTLFTRDPALTNHGAPVALFAARPTRKGHSARPGETLAPLSRALRVPIQTPFPAKDADRVAKTILKDPAYDGKTVVVCWVHDELPALAEALGVKPRPPDWRGHVFDRMWVISYAGKQATLQDLPQNLLPGDSRR